MGTELRSPGLACLHPGPHTAGLQPGLFPPPPPAGLICSTVPPSHPEGGFSCRAHPPLCSPPSDIKMSLLFQKPEGSLTMMVWAQVHLPAAPRHSLALPPMVSRHLWWTLDPAAHSGQGAPQLLLPPRPMAGAFLPPHSSEAVTPSPRPSPWPPSPTLHAGPRGYFHSTMLMQAFLSGFWRVRHSKARGGRGRISGTGFLGCFFLRLSSCGEGGSMFPGSPAPAPHPLPSPVSSVPSSPWELGC